MLRYLSWKPSARIILTKSHMITAASRKMFTCMCVCALNHLGVKAGADIGVGSERLVERMLCFSRSVLPSELTVNSRPGPVLITILSSCPPLWCTEPTCQPLCSSIPRAPRP